MRKLIIEITAENSAFENPEQELSELLREVALKIEHGNLQGGGIFDSNGNDVGSFDFYDE